MRRTFDGEFVDAFAEAWGFRQTGVIVHHPNVVTAAFVEEAELIDGVVCVDIAGEVGLPAHTRIYKP